MTILRPMIFIVLLGLSVALQGCARYRVVVPEPTPATDYRAETMHAYFWGAIEDTQPTDNCDANAIDEVRVQHTVPNILATVLTLGIWMPLKVEWKCAKRAQGDGTGF